MRIDEQDIENIKNQVNIVDLVSKYINVTKKGNSHIALCPFHSDTNPSMHISEEKQIYKCFSCGEGGNAFTFVQQYEQVSYPKAVTIVADFINYDMSKYQTQSATKIDEKKEKLYNLVKNASEFYNFCLVSEDGEEGKKYFDQRKIDNNIINKFKLGYAPEDSSKILMFLTRKGYSVEEIEEAGIGLTTGGVFTDRFKGRVIFPLSDLNGNIVAFSGRKITNQDIAKYVNSNETSLFKKSELLYNYYEARNEIKKNNRVYLVEGFMDVIALSKVGINNVVATMGTAISERHLKALKSLNVEIVLSLDADDAGQTATFKITERLLNIKGLKVGVTKTTKEDKDLDDILNHQGKEAVIKYLNNTYSIYEFIFYYMLNRVNLNNHSDKINFVREFTNFMNLNIKDQIEREYFANLLSEKIGLEKTLISDYIDKTPKNVLKSSVVNRPNIGEKKDRYYRAEVEIIKQMLNDTKAITYYLSYLRVMYDTNNKKMALYICDAYQKRVSIEEMLKDLEQTDPEIYLGIIKILNDKSLPENFNPDVFDVVKHQKPLQMDIDDIDEKIKVAENYDQVLVLNKERQVIKSKLDKLRKQYTPKKGDLDD